MDLLHLSDGKLRTHDGSEFAIHKFVLSAKNKYFLRLFCGPLGKDRSDFLIPGIGGNILESILSFIYTSAIDISENNAFEILLAADYLLCDELINHIKDVYMIDSLTVSNSLPLYLAARIINQNDILCTCYRFIQTHFEEVVSVDNPEICELPLEALQLFLGDKNLSVKDENAIWVVIAKWVQADPDHRQPLVPDLLLYLAVSDVDEQLSKKILEHDAVACNPFCGDLQSLKRWSLLNFYHLFDWIWGCLNHKILGQYIQKHSKTISHSFSFRSPDHIHFIVERRSTKSRNKYDVCVHVTYDESLDLWRELFTVPTESHRIFFDFKLLHCIGDNIYMSQHNEGIIHRFNLPSKTWIGMLQFNDFSEIVGYGVVELRGLIYVIGGISTRGGERVVLGEVNVYDPDKDVWYQVAPMMPVYHFRTTTLKGKIYVISSFVSTEISQSYDSETNTWTVLSPPLVAMYCLGTFTYRGRLLVLGKSSADEEYKTTIEAFDPAREEWSAHENLPHRFIHPIAIVVNNGLIVYEKDSGQEFEPNPAVLWNEEDFRQEFEPNPPVLWNEEFQYWEVLRESYSKHIWQYFRFVTQDTGGRVNGILKENKDPTTQFLNSPFNNRV